MPRGPRIPILIELQGGGASGGQEESGVVITRMLVDGSYVRNEK